MRKCINGKFVDFEYAPDELATLEADLRRASLMERSRALTAEEVSRMLITAQINTLAVDDNTALRMLEFYPEWAEGADYAAGYKVRYGGRLWRCVQAHTAQAGWEPSTGTAALWEQVCETHDGTLDDPIPYDGNMALTAGLYYHQNYEVYRCTRDTINPVYNTLAELVGIYVEVI